MVHVAKISYNGDINIGLFATATDRFVLTPPDYPRVDEVLHVPQIFCSVADTPLIGLFVAANSNGLLLPKIVDEKERETIKKALRDAGIDINIATLRSKHTVLGNLVVCNDKGAVISENLKSSKKKIEDVLGVEVSISRIARSKLPGSYTVATNKGFLLSNLGSEEDYEVLEKTLRVEGDLGSVNFGSCFVRSGIVANSYGYVVGEQTTGVEIARIDEALGFLK